MQVGIKVGPTTWKAFLSVYRPQVCEVWFRIDWLDRYAELFAYLRKHEIPAGLHFWGNLAGNVMPNFAFPDRDVRDSSLELVRKTIDVACEHGFRYVNIHPGSYRLSTIDLEQLSMLPVGGRITSPRIGARVLIENISQLHSYATSRNVMLLVETLPCREPMNFKDLAKGRLRTQNMENVPLATVEKLAKKGFFVCNDFCHTAMDVISDDREFLFSKLLSKTKRLAAQTRLVHVNTMLPPFNGTDGHLGILEEDFKNRVFPSREQLRALLSVFSEREDVWAVPEPFSRNVENSRALEEMLKVFR